MTTITLKNIPNAEDKDKTIILNGEEIGTVMWGWLRLGGEQWTAQLSNTSTFGAKTLKELKSKILHQVK